DLGRQSQHRAQLPDLVLAQLAPGLDQLAAHVRGQAAHVVMRLDGRRRPLERDRLDHVRIEGALGKPRDLPELAGLVLEHRDELGPDGLALYLRIGDTFQAIDESLACVDMYEIY